MRLGCDFRLVLSGTPIQNSILELRALFDFLMPGYLGDKRHFNKLYGKAAQVHHCCIHHPADTRLADQVATGCKREGERPGDGAAAKGAHQSASDGVAVCAQAPQVRRAQGTAAQDRPGRPLHHDPVAERTVQVTEFSGLVFD